MWQLFIVSGVIMVLVILWVFGLPKADGNRLLDPDYDPVGIPEWLGPSYTPKGRSFTGVIMDEFADMSVIDWDGLALKRRMEIYGTEKEKPSYGEIVFPEYHKGPDDGVSLEKLRKAHKETKFINPIYKEKPMSNAREVAEDMILKAKEMAAEGERKLKELEEPTYSIGDRFNSARGDKHMLAVSMSGTGEVSVVDLDTGCLYSGAREVQDNGRITQAELDQFHEGTLTRYWDNCTKKYTDGREQGISEFHVPYSDNGPRGIECRVKDGGNIELQIQGSHSRYFTSGVKQFKLLHQKLGQLLRSI